MKTNKVISFYISIVIIFTLNACAPAQILVTPTSPSTATVLPSATQTSTSTASVTETARLIPTQTDTPTAELTLTPLQNQMITSTPVAMSEEMQKEIKAYGYDPKTGRLLPPKPVIEPLKADGASFEQQFSSDDWSGLTEYVLHYEVKADGSASIAGCGTAFHIWDGFIAVNNQGTAMWVVSSFEMGQENYISRPKTTSAFNFKKGVFIPFTLVVKGNSVAIYSGAKQIGHVTVDKTSGAVGWMVYNVSGDDSITCTFQNAWVWSAN